MRFGHFHCAFAETNMYLGYSGRISDHSLQKSGISTVGWHIVHVMRYFRNTSSRDLDLCLSDLNAAWYATRHRSNQPTNFVLPTCLFIPELWMTQFGHISILCNGNAQLRMCRVTWPVIVWEGGGKDSPHGMIPICLSSLSIRWHYGKEWIMF